MKTRLIAIPFMLVGTAALGHVVFIAKGIHFKAEAIDFGQPPVRWGGDFNDGTGGLEPWRPGTRYEHGFWDEEEAKEARQTALRKSLMKKGARAEMAGELSAARNAYRQLRQTGLGDPAFLGAREELLSTPNIANARGLKPFLLATHPLTHGPFPKNPSAMLLPWIAYAKAKTVADYLDVANRFPRSSRAEASLAMVARSIPNGTKPTAADIRRAGEAAGRLLDGYPKSRFIWDAQGVLARLDFIRGRYREASRQYEILLKRSDRLSRKASAIQSIIACERRLGRRAGIAHGAVRWMAIAGEGDPYAARNFLLKTLDRFTAADSRDFYRRLARDPQSFADYLEFRAGLDATADDVLALASNAQRASAGTPVRPRIDAILAGVALAKGDRKAQTYAVGALRGTGDAQAYGNFVLGTLDRRAGRFANAKQRFSHLIAEHPKSYLVGGARENLAILNERLGNLDGAMDQYRALGYQQDVAFLADARMTPSQLAAYVAKHPDSEDLRYVLAMRCLRRSDWDGAARALRPFSDAKRRWLTSAFVYPSSAERDGGLQDPLKTLTALRNLDEAVKSAKDSESRAKALLAMGDYYYSHRCLLLYSGPAWRGWRDESFSFSWNSKVATANDDDALVAHFDEHECYNQAIRRYQRILSDYPNASVAGQAAYKEAVALKRLSNMAPYWRWRDRFEDRKAKAIRLMALAAESTDPEIARKAKKYGPVFTEEREEFRAAFAKEKPTSRRWTSRE